MTVNSLLYHLLSWMNKAKHSGIMQNDCRPQHTGLWAILRTSTVFLWLLLSLASQTVSFFSFFALSPLPPDKAWLGIRAVQTSASRTEDL